MDFLSTDPQRPGFFAIGQEAVGVIALGQSAMGVVAIGQMARGVVCVGQLAVGIIAAGQGAVGLWHGTGMLALAGQSGLGVALHLLPRLAPAEAALPATTTAAALASGAVSEGWLSAQLGRTATGELRIVVEGAPQIDLTSVRVTLLSGLGRGADRAHLCVRASVIVDELLYRSAETHVELVATNAIAHSSHRGWAYGKPPRGALRARAGKAEILGRSALWLVAAGVVTWVALLPLVRALLG